MKQHIVLLAAGLLLASCNLDLQPENGLTYTNSFKTEKELNATTSSIHYFLNSALSEDYVFQTAGVVADELQEGNQVREWNPKSIIDAQDWKKLYDVIFEANLLIDNIDRTEGLTEARRNYHLGQAYFALGVSYLTLVQRFGDVPVMENSKVIKAYDTTPQLQVLDKAAEYAQRALELLPTHDKLRDINGSPISSRQFASKGNSTALLAHIYAWKGSIIDLYKLKGDAQEAYRKTVEYATQVIDQKVGSYQLCDSPETLCQLLSEPTKTNPEVVFTLSYDVTRSIYTTTPNLVASAYTSWPVNETKTLGKITSETTARLYAETINAMYENNDLRRTAYFYEIDTPHEVDGNNYALFYKFRNGVYDTDQYAEGGKSFRSLNADLVQWRLADLYLLRAECNAKLGQDASAIADLNVIRSRAQATAYPAATDTEGLQKAIYFERTKEFLGENDSHYFDIIRNGYYATELKGKFRVLSAQNVNGGALVLPVPAGAREDKDGHLVNPLIHQKPYWVQYQ